MNEAAWWDRFHSVHSDTEWYGAGASCVALLPSSRSRILHVGCGTSALGDALAAADGVASVLSTDFSPEAIAVQRARWKVAGGAHAFAVEDASDLSGHGDSSFSCVVDKGTLDAILADRADDSLERGRAAVREWLRVGGGCVLIGSMIGPHTRAADLESFLTGCEATVVVHAVPEPPLEKPSQESWWWYELLTRH